MVKKLALLLFLSVFVLANESYEMAKNMLQNPSKTEILKLLFSNQDLKDENDKVDLEKLTRVLKINSLLNLTLDEPKNLHLSFKSSAAPALFFKILNDALNSSGYVYYIPTDLILKNNEISYKIEIRSQYILDPSTFYKLLKENSVFITNIKRIGSYDYEYELDFTEAKLKPDVELEPNQSKLIEKILKEYTINLENVKILEIEANSMDRWFAKILLLDKNLNLIKAIKRENKTPKISVQVPNNAIYAIIGDLYNLNNIKRGLKITIK